MILNILLRSVVNESKAVEESVAQAIAADDDAAENLAKEIDRTKEEVKTKARQLAWILTDGKQGQWSGGSSLDREVIDDLGDDPSLIIKIAGSLLPTSYPSPGKETASVLRDSTSESFSYVESAVIRDIETGSNPQNLKTNRAYLFASARYGRSPVISALTKIRGNFSCEIDSCDYQPFLTPYGIGFVESHHIIPLSEDGLDDLSNTASLCPCHHREVHFGKNAESLKTELQALRHSEDSLSHNEDVL